MGKAKKHLSDLYNMVVILSGKYLDNGAYKKVLRFKNPIFIESIVVYHKIPSEDQGQEIVKIDPLGTLLKIKNSTEENKVRIKEILTQLIEKHLENILDRAFFQYVKISECATSSKKIVKNFEIIFY